jgi:translocation and assembly module TamA
MSTDSPICRCCLLLVLLLPLVAMGAQQVQVQISGLSGEPLDNVRASLSLEQNRRRAGLTARDIREFYAEATAEIMVALEPFGYYRAQIDAGLQPPAGEGAPWLATFHVDPGKQVPITHMQIAFDGGADADPALQKIAAGLALQEGQGLDHRRYEQAKRDLVEQVKSLGYRDASLIGHRVEVDLEPYEAHVLLRVNSGPRFVIGDIEFEQDEFQPSYLARYLLLKPGDVYTSNALAEQRRALSRSGYFREVEIEPQPVTAAEPHAIPLRIRLETFPPNRYRARLAWGTDTGVGGQLDWNRRYVGGRGQRFTAGFAAVEERNKLAGDVSYVIPLQPLAGSMLTFNARHESKDLTFEDVELDEGGETRIATNVFSVGWRRPHLVWGDFEVEPKAGLGLLNETYDVFEVLFGNLSGSAQQVIIEQIGREAYDTLTPDFRAVIPTLSLNLRRSDGRLFIDNGDSLDLKILGASEALGSNLSFWQARLNSWHIRSIGNDSRLLLRTSMGYSDAKSSEVLGVNFNKMPEYYEFRAGGALSVRGYEFESLYPSDSLTGGKSELVGSIEYDYELIPDWSVALFVDAGNAFNRWEDYDARVGAGIGMRWRSPVGTARIDLGFPLNDSDEVFQVYITVGPEF